MTDTEQLLSDSIDKISELSIENHRLKAQIEELIKENEEMKSGLGCETCQIHLEYMGLNNRIDDLERENKELKAGRDINVFTKQLTKAKEIIKTFLGFAEAFGYSPSMDKFISEAEQFLKEE